MPWSKSERKSAAKSEYRGEGPSGPLGVYFLPLSSSTYVGIVQQLPEQVALQFAVGAKKSLFALR
eukprot:scaffold1647_cov148-Skeletonema_menzelii.AAC.6